MRKTLAVVLGVGCAIAFAGIASGGSNDDASTAMSVNGVRYRPEADAVPALP